jgi:hypothetical protein
MLAIIVILALMLVTNVASVNAIWIVFPLITIRASTVIIAILSFGLVLFLQNRITSKSIYYAVLAVIFSMGLYETIWYYLALPFFGYDLNIFQFVALFGWVLLGVKEVFHTRPSRLSTELYIIFVVSLVL